MVKFKYDINYIIGDLIFSISENNYFREEQLRLISEEYPELYTSIMNAPERFHNKIITEFIQTLNKHYGSEIGEYAEKLNSKWHNIEKPVMHRLNQLLDISWNKECIGYVGILPIYSRDLSTRSFCLFYKDNIEDSIGIALHEITHFIYFDKWKLLKSKLMFQK